MKSKEDIQKIISQYAECIPPNLIGDQFEFRGYQCRFCDYSVVPSNSVFICGIERVFCHKYKQWVIDYYCNQENIGTKKLTKEIEDMWERREKTPPDEFYSKRDELRKTYDEEAWLKREKLQGELEGKVDYS